MTRSRYRITDNSVPHFITCVAADWTPLFTRSDMTNIILAALTRRRQQGTLKLFGYVILENHFHGIVQADDLSKVIKQFKMYTANAMIATLQTLNATKVLQRLAFAKKTHKTNSTYQVWEEGSHPQLIADDKMMRQKLDYIHYNPVRRGYVDDPSDWRLSSARNYEGREGVIEVDIWSG